MIANPTPAQILFGAETLEMFALQADKSRVTLPATATASEYALTELGLSTAARLARGLAAEMRADVARAGR